MDDNHQRDNCQSEVFAFLADPATHALPNMQRQLQMWTGDMLSGYSVSGCLPTVPASSPPVRKGG